MLGHKKTMEPYLDFGVFQRLKERKEFNQVRVSFDTIGCEPGVDLDLGEELVFEFISQYLPEESDRVGKIFSKSGAYSRFKDLLSKKGLLDKWYDFEDEQNKNALKQWCLENDIKIKD